MKYNKNQFEYFAKEFLEFLTNSAIKARDSAALSGEWGDGGASRVLEQISIYKAGQYNQLPPEWEGHLKEFNKENDPDYLVYLELKKKFD